MTTPELIQVNRDPGFRCTCVKCEKPLSTWADHVWADRNGPAFKAYFCEGCALAAGAHPWVERCSAPHVMATKAGKHWVRVG